ncbi:hypothetical protein J6590_001441 [Homalodisca vitripennis]|nr:hypothetical protein J6590_001441 [Homalodisca vitripennis]
MPATSKVAPDKVSADDNVSPLEPIPRTPQAFPPGNNVQTPFTSPLSADDIELLGRKQDFENSTYCGKSGARNTLKGLEPEIMFLAAAPSRYRYSLRALGGDFHQWRIY